MPFAPGTFRHVPALEGRVRAPEDSDFRLSYARFDELDKQAKAEGWPDGWRMDHGAREENRHTVLNGRMTRDLWIFAYGSLIWDPAVHADEFRLATLDGWHRSFCMHLTGGRGSQRSPGLMAVLDKGGICHGIALRIPAALVDAETEKLWMREMFSGTYIPSFLKVTTPQGDLEALAFVINHESDRYDPGLDPAEAARRIARATGRMGENFDYLDSMARHLADLGIDDPDIGRLHRLASAERAAAET